MLDQLARLDRAVVRPGRVHVEVAEDPLAVGERIGRPPRAPPAGDAPVHLVQLAGDIREGPALDAPAGFVAQLLAEGLVLGEPRERGGGELGLLLHSGRRGDRRTGRGGFERDPREPVERGHEDRGLLQERRAGAPVARGPHVHAPPQARWDRGPAGERLRP